MSAAVVLGAIAGWTNRSPDVMAVPREASVAIPVLWVDPSWSVVNRKAGAAEQLHYAIFEAPHEERVAAFLAVPGFFSHSHDQVSRAYTQLARIWFRDCNIEALETLESELSAWKSAKTHEQELVSVVRIAVNLRKSDLDGVLEGFKGIDARRSVRHVRSGAGRARSRDLHRRPGGCDPGGYRVDFDHARELAAGAGAPGHAALPDRGSQGQSRAVASRSQAKLSPRAGWELRSMAFLKRANGDTSGQIIELKPERITIGRSPEHCHIVLEPNGVSRRHAEIYRNGDDFYLADLNSRNTTRVNNAKVIPGIDHRLVTGDRINICDVEFLFYPQLPANGASKDGGEIMIVNEAENHEAPQLHVLDASRSSAMASMIKPEVKLKAILEISRNLSSELKIDTVAPGSSIRSWSFFRRPSGFS